MWMSNHQLPFLQRGQFGSRRRAQYCIAGSRQLVGVHPAEESRPRVSDDTPMNLGPELLRAEQNEAEVPAPLRDIEQHFSDVSIGSITRRVFVELVDEDDEMLDAQIPTLQVLAELGHDASEDEILSIFLEVGDVDYIHRAIRKAPEWEIAYIAGVGDQSGAAGGDVRQAVADLANGGHMMGAPALAVPLLHSLKYIAEPGIQVGERLHFVGLRQNGIPEFLVEDILLDEIDQRVCLGVNVVLVEQNLRELKDLTQPPGQRSHLIE